MIFYPINYAFFQMHDLYDYYTCIKQLFAKFRLITSYTNVRHGIKFLIMRFYAISVLIFLFYSNV